MHRLLAHRLHPSLGGWAVQPLPGPLARHCSRFSTAPSPPGHRHWHRHSASPPCPLLRIQGHLHPPLRQGPTGPPIEPSFQAEGLVLSSHKPRRGGDGAAPQRHGCLCPSCAAPGPSPPPTCSEEQMSAPSPPGPATWPPSTCPQVPSSPASEPSRGNRHRGRQLLRGAWARPAGMPAALQLTMPTGRKAQGLAPGLPRAGERVPRVLAVAGGVGPAGTWRSVTFESQASWATMPPACLLPPAAAPTQPWGAVEGGRWWANPSNRRGVQGWLIGEPGPGGDSSERKPTALTRCPGCPAPAPAGPAGSPVEKSGSGATRARLPELGFKWVHFHQLGQKSVCRESPFPCLLQQTGGASKTRFWSQFQCERVCPCACMHERALCGCACVCTCVHLFIRVCTCVCTCVCVRVCLGGKVFPPLQQAVLQYQLGGTTQSHSDTVYPDKAQTHI